MSTNLINNYINSSKPQLPGILSAKKEKLEAYSQYNKMKPLDGKGRLVSSSVLDAPKLMAQGISYDLKSLRKGLKGESNDHQLGKTNDIGMKLGGLAIASYLFSKRSTPTTKTMEFVGFASFFASMAIWPKLAIQLPARIIHGVDVQKKYKDSQGRTKPFFQDPQYIPWDLYSAKQIDKIGDKLGVSRDIPNRRDFIQEKMKKIAVQNNTLWMLTAGFATPVMSALICNAAEKYVLKTNDKRNTDLSDSMLNNVDKFAKNIDHSESEKELDYILDYRKNDPLFRPLLKDISKAVSPSVDPLLEKKIEQDLADILIRNAYVMDEQVAKNALIMMKINLEESFSDDEIKAVLPSVEDFVDFLKRTTYDDKILFENEFPEHDLFHIRLDMIDFLHQRVDESKLDPQKLDEIKSIITNSFGNLEQKDIEEPSFSPLKSRPANTLNSKAIIKIREIVSVFKDFTKKASVLDEYAYKKVADAPETALANAWNKITADFPELFGFSEKEIQVLKFDRLPVQKALRDKIETIVSNDEKYEELLDKLAKKIKSIDEKILPDNVKKYHDVINNLHSDVAIKLHNMGMHFSADKIDRWEPKIKALEKAFNENDEIKFKEWGIHKDEAPDLINKFWNNETPKGDFEQVIKRLSKMNKEGTGSLLRVKNTFFDERLNGVKNSFYRLVDTLDLYRRVAKKDFADSIFKEMSIEAKEEMVEYSKQLLLFGHASDQAIKGYFKRNQNPSTKTGELNVLNGKVIPQFYNENSPHNVDIPWDFNFYKNFMRFIYGNKTQSGGKYAHEMNPSTQKILEKRGLLKDIQKYNKEFYEKIGGSDYFQKAYHKTVEGVKATDEEKFLLAGLAPDEMFTKLFNQKFNTKKWSKTYVRFGAALLGITVFSQFFFGNLPEPRKINKDAK